MNTETTYNEYETVVDAIREQSIAKRVASSIKQKVRSIAKSMLRSHWERQAVRELASLPPYVLRDIGLRPDEIREVSHDLARERADAWARQAQGSNGFGG